MSGLPDRRSALSSSERRDALARRLTSAVGRLDDPHQPLAVVDLDAFDVNAADLARRAAGTPIRVASKSLRVPALVSRALHHDGFAGVLGYTLREALWLVSQGVCDDVLLGYPTVDAGALRTLTDSPAALAAITLMVDDPAHLDVVDAARTSDAPVRVAIDIDAGLRLGPTHLGPKRSPLHDVSSVVDLARAIVARPGFSLVGVMTYEGQVAGVPDGTGPRSLAIRGIKRASLAQLLDRRARIHEALTGLVDLEFWNAGGSGSLESTGADPAVTELAAGSGLLGPTLFDQYTSFSPTPAAFFGVPVVRRPSESIATVAGGGFVASGAAGPDRLPTPWAPSGLELTGLEGAGEVQTPLSGPGAASLAIGDLVWFRHAKSGELFEHASQAHLVSGVRVVDSVPSYRGLGCTW